MSENRCNRCNRRLSDTTAQYGEKCAKILGYRDPKNSKSEGVADIQHITHGKIAELERHGIDWRRDIGLEMLYDMVREEYLKGLNGHSNLQKSLRMVRKPPQETPAFAALKEQIVGAIPKAEQKAALLIERLPEWYQMNMEYSKEKVGYDDKIFEKMGCGALAMAMIIKALTGTAVSPLELAQYAVENGHYHGRGIEGSFFLPIATSYGLDVSEIYYNQKVADEVKIAAKAEVIASLRSGNPVIAHMGPGNFTNGGHYMVLAGVSEDGKKILVYDGGNRARFNKFYDTDLIFDQAKGNFRVLTYDGRYQDDGITFN